MVNAAAGLDTAYPISLLGSLSVDRGEGHITIVNMHRHFLEYPQWTCGAGDAWRDVG